VNATAIQWIAFAVLIPALGLVVGGVWFMLFGSRPDGLAPTEEFSAITDEPTERIPKYREPRHVLLVVAGTYRQYEEYCATLGLNRFHDAIYISDVSRIRECRGQRYVLVGTWADRPDLAEIRRVLALQDCIPL
jgi:hypothetical protein